VMGCIGSRIAIGRNRRLNSSRRNSRSQNIFTVLNVDDMGRQISPGKLEVSETDLVLYVRGKPPLTWPLRCLRRYGFDNDLFSFESGRRCPTGAGIFAFRCDRAQSLFNLLQSKIQANPGATPNTVPSTPITPSNVCGNPSTPVSSTFVYVNLAENSTARQSANNAPPDVTQVSGSASVLPNNIDSIVNGCGSSFPSSQSFKSSQENSHPLYMNVESTSSSYANSSQIAGNVPGRYGLKQVQSAPGNSSSNLPFGNRHISHLHQKSLDGQNSQYSSYSRNQETIITNDLLLYTNVICSPGDPSSKVVSYDFNSACREPAEVNYAELDLKTDNCSCSSNTSRTNLPTSNKGRLAFLSNKENNWPSLGGHSSRSKLKGEKPISCAGDCGATKPHEYSLQASARSESSQISSEAANLGYATIDFDRTAALSVVTRSKINLDFHASATDEHEGSSRKTRHNSTAL